MAQLNARNDSFISMLLEVSGRARPSDLHSVPSSEAPALLAAYRSAHPEMPLGFEDDTLVYMPSPAAASAAPAPAPVTAAAPAPVTAAVPAPVTAAAPAPAEPAPEVAASAAASLDSVVPAVTPAPSVPETTMWDFTSPEPTVSDSGAVATQPAPYARAAEATTDAESAETLPSWVYPAETGVDTDLTDFAAPPPPADYVPAVGDFEELPPYETTEPPTAPLPLWKWLLAGLLPLLGFLWYFELRREDPQGAQRLLVFTVAAAVVLVALLVAFVMLFGPSLIAAFAA